MSTKIAPAPPPHLAPSLPRIAILPNQQPVLLIPKSYTGQVSIPVRVSPNNERSHQTFQFIQPKPHMQLQEDAPRGSNSQRMDDQGIAEYLPSTQQRRDILKRKIQERPSKQYLIRKHILLTDPLVEPFVGEKTHQLRKQAVVSNLNRKLKSRPGPLDLVTKKILQADAELEEAIKEGRLLFPSSRRELESPSPSTPQAPSPSVLLSSLRISKQESIREEREEEARQAAAAQAYHQAQVDHGMMDNSDDQQEDQRGRKYGRVEARTQPHPYARMDATQPSPAKGRLKGPDSKSGAEYTTVPDNFEAMMKQQELFIEWRTRPEGNDHGPQSQAHMMHPHEDGGESDSGETIPYGDEEETTTTTMPTTITYRVYPSTEQPSEAPDSTVIVNHSKNAPRTMNGSIRPPIHSLADIKKTDLMQECRHRGLKCGGDKTTIMMRLEGLKDEIIAKFKEENARLDALALENSPQISNERALSNTSSSSSPSTIIEDMSYDVNGMARIDESIAHRRHSLPSNNPHQGIARSLNPPTRHLSMSSGTHPQATAAPTISTLSFSQNPQHGQMEKKIQMKTANGEIFYATLPSTDDLPIPRDGKPIGCKIAIINGKPVLQFQQPSGPIEPGNVGAAGIRDTLLFAQNGSGGQVTLGPHQKERTRSNSLNRKSTYSGECNSISSLLRSNSSNSTLPVMVQRTQRSQSTSTTMSGKAALKAHLAIPREVRKSSAIKQVISPQELPPPAPKEPSVQAQVPQGQQGPQETYQPPQEQPLEFFQPQEIQQPQESYQQPQEIIEPQEVVESQEPKEEVKQELSEAEQVAAHAQAINKLLNREIKLTLDAKTVLEHEQALRGQQRMIDSMQKELKKSLTALKMQQQLIVSAKKAQSEEIQKMTNNKLKNIGEAWLFELNLKRLHKSNSNFFLTHKQQEEELQALTEEQKRIQKQNINIQLSEASDSAIKDITKFIGANPKTALLIVQLLKKYQNDKSQAANQPTQTFADIPPFEVSERTPTARTIRADAIASHDYIMESQPGPSHLESMGHDDNANLGGSQEAIVIDDDSNDEDVAPKQQGRLRLSAPPMRNRRKDQRVRVTQVDMEAIFRTVLDGSKTGNPQVQMHSGSPADGNMNKLGEHSSPHSVSSVPSSHSMAGIGPSDSSSSPCSSSTPPEMMMAHQMMQPQMHYVDPNLYPVRAVSDGPMDYTMVHPVHVPPFEPLGRPYVSDGLGSSADDNPTDILMEAVESSGIVDDSIGGGGGDEPMPSSSHSMQQMQPHDHMMMPIDDNIIMNGDFQVVGDHLMMGDQGYDFLNDASLFNNFDPAAFEGFDPRVLDPAPEPVVQPAPDLFERYRDICDIIQKDDHNHEKRSPDSKKVAYNGTEELNKILGPSWMDMGEPSTSGDHQMHPMALEIPGANMLPHDDAFEDVFAPSSHVVGTSQSTTSSSLLAPPHSPMITDMSWLNDEEVRAALSPKGPPFGDFDGFDPTNP